MISKGSQRAALVSAVLLLPATVATVTWLGLEPGTGLLRPGLALTTQTKAAGATGERQQPGGGLAGGAITVEVATSRESETTTDIQTIGSLQSNESVVLAPELAGRVVDVAFKEGQPVKTGDILIKLDDELAQAEAADAKARLTLASANLDRARALIKSGSVTGKGKDEATANFETARAAVDLATTRLGKLILRAPFDGVAGLKSISVGAFVTAGAPIANLEMINTLKVDFSVPEIHLQDIGTGQKIALDVDAVPGRRFEGVIYAINPLVDVNGRALQVRARLDNADMALRPGLFARITIKGLSQRKVVLVPEAAILPRGEDTYVYRIDNGKAVETRVKLGQRQNSDVEIVDGLSGGATVVTAGQQKLRDGMAVEVVPADVKASRQGDVRPGARPADSGRS